VLDLTALSNPKLKVNINDFFREFTEHWLHDTINLAPNGLFLFLHIGNQILDYFVVLTESLKVE
jgi:hypothetical protein